VGAVAGVAAGLGASPEVGVAAGVAMAAVAAGVAYATVRRQIAGRLELARRTLREARKRRFDALATLPGATARDELDDLIHQVGRAGLALQREIDRL